MRFIKFAVLAALLLMLTSTAEAGVLSSILTLNGNADQIGATGSRVNVLDLNSNSVGASIDIGDLVYGFVEFEDATNDFFPGPSTSGDPSPNSVAVAFAVEVTGIADGNGLFPAGTLELGVVSDASLSLRSLLGDVVGVSDLVDSDLFAVLGNVTTDVGATANFAETATPTTVGGFATSGTPDGLSGFDSNFAIELAGGLISPDDFFVFNPSTSTGPQQTGGFGVRIAPGFTSDTIFVPVPTSQPVPVPFGAPDLTGGVSGVSLEITPVEFNSAVGADGFAFTADATFTINAVPEPTSALVFAGIFSLVVIRRRN